MAAPPVPDPHPFAAAWPPIETTVFEFWGLARPAMNAVAEQQGIPLALHNYAELGLETLSVAEALRRDPYSRPEDFAGEFARLAAAGWLETIEDGDDPMTARYVVLPHAREAVRAIDAAGDALLGDLVAVPDTELARIHELLAMIHAANLAAPEPPARWAAERRFRSAGEATPLPGRIREATLDLLAYRDDVHLAAWSAHADPATEGALWNAFSHDLVRRIEHRRGHRAGRRVPRVRRVVLRAGARGPRSARVARRGGRRVPHDRRWSGAARRGRAADGRVVLRTVGGDRRGGRRGAPRARRSAATLAPDPVRSPVMDYVVVIEETENGFGAYVPDLPGCIAAGDTREETEALIREAVSHHVEMLREHGDPVPEPRATAGLASA